MDPGWPKQPTRAGVLPGTPALESVVRAHSDQLIKLSSAFAQVTGEMGDLRTSATSTSTALASLSNQVSALTDLVTQLLPVRTGGAASPAPPVVHQPPTSVPVTLLDQPFDARWEPSLSPPMPTPVGLICAGVSWGSVN